MYSCTYSCTYPSRSHRLVVFRILCTCHVLYFRFMSIFLYFSSCTLFLVLTFMFFSCISYFMSHVLIFIS
ncbi:hypothetical protein M6B38_254330 [Iris pallida]|uniref:Uncharacterized protein n=1 Tax=Iris pallida TaxID=29817 RepID=A0AAX6IH50_IRIPA|nr:hypothetical protein M6B38_254330 [Iris pallida]